MRKLTQEELDMLSNIERQEYITKRIEAVFIRNGLKRIEEPIEEQTAIVSFRKHKSEQPNPLKEKKD